ncbi:hypothetical protein [Pectobacterium phage Jarilo]|uniref:Uncharacterized protein n=1 Tax=Pectobacterium phage Jarilo TaxID=2163634 RepID=A0A2S1GT18_9CAUD|nr:hypothetical protein HOT17_gp08 [Pectobacterium phage Jarilo]AWD92489.1 hypothetical protein [Pectobacterium phage Jarilo]
MSKANFERVMTKVERLDAEAPYFNAELEAERQMKHDRMRKRHKQSRKPSGKRSWYEGVEA